ncbi:hypothetical protein B0H11DRAFT_1917714 [Mycena galericulata]|nr:hypothetical protein B0H11DRAFT_1917714 [Mycena galericulata]
MAWTQTGTLPGRPRALRGAAVTRGTFSESPRSVAVGSQLDGPLEVMEMAPEPQPTNPGPSSSAADSESIYPSSNDMGSSIKTEIRTLPGRPRFQTPTLTWQNPFHDSYISMPPAARKISSLRLDSNHHSYKDTSLETWIDTAKQLAPSFLEDSSLVFALLIDSPLSSSKFLPVHNVPPHLSNHNWFLQVDDRSDDEADTDDEILDLPDNYKVEEEEGAEVQQEPPELEQSEDMALLHELQKLTLGSEPLPPRAVFTNLHDILFIKDLGIPPPTKWQGRPNSCQEQDLTQIFRPSSSDFRQLLVEVQSANFQKAFSLMDSVEPSFLGLITGKANAPFTKINAHSLRTYGREESRLLLTVQHYAAQNSRSRVPPMMFTLEQEKALFTLNVSLAQCVAAPLQDSRHAVDRAVSQLLSSIYFPQQTGSFERPVIAFVCIQAIKQGNDGWVSANQICKVLSYLRFAIRLRALEEISSGGKDQDFILQFCNSMLMGEHSIHAEVCRMLRHSVRASQKQNPHALLRRGLELSVQKHWITPDMWCRFLRNLVRTLKDLITTKVLLGIAREELGAKDALNRINDRGSMEVGWGPISSDPELGYSPGSKKLLEAFLRKQSMSLELSSNWFRVDQMAFEAWLANIQRAVEIVYVLVHIVGAPIPLTTAQESFLLITSTDGSGHPQYRDTFVVQGCIAFIRRGVGDNSGERRPWADRLLLLPPEISQEIYLLVNVVRPVEVILLLHNPKVLPIQMKARLEAIRNARDHIFWSGGKTMTAHQKAKAFARETGDLDLGIRIGLKDYHKMATAWAPPKLRGKALRPIETTVADKQAGRTVATSQQNYGVLGSNHGMQPLLRQQQLHEIRQWHDFLGFGRSVARSTQSR